VEALLSIRDLDVVFDTFDGTSRVLRSLAIMGLIPVPGRVASGTITFEDRELLGLPETAMARLRGSQLSMILQSPMTSLNPVFTVKAQMIEVLQSSSKLGKKEAIERAKRLLNTVRISDPESVLNKYPFELSGGISQRVMIAMAISSEPALLIADEPTTALDVTVEKQIIKLVRDLRSRLGSSLIWISHDLGVVRQVCERIAVMYAGTVVEVGKAEAILTDPMHPYTRALVESIPSRRQRGKRLREIPGVVPDLLNVPEGCVFADRCQKSNAECFSGAPPGLVQVSPERRVACYLI